MSSAALVVEGVSTAGTAVANLSSSTAIALVCRSDDGAAGASTVAGAPTAGGSGIGGCSTCAEDTDDVCCSSATLVGGGAGLFAAGFVLLGAERTSRPSGPRYQHLRSVECSSR